MVTKLTKKQIYKYLNFLGAYRSYVGFSDWDIDLNSTAKDLGNMILASVNTNIYEKRLSIKISEDFLSRPEEEQAKILFHELVHSRIRYTEDKVDEFKSIEEEHLVNDLVRGFDGLVKFKFTDKPKKNKKIKKVKI